MYFDLERELRTNGQFRDRLVKITKDLNYYTIKARENSKYKNQTHDLIRELLRMCKFNFSLLTPYYFPKYPKNEPFTLKNHPFQYALYHIELYGYIVVRASRQIGKEQPYTADVQTLTGYKKMGDLNVGDYVIGCDGRPYPIKEIIEQGESDVYELTFTDDSKAECGLDHNWVTRGSGCKYWKVETLRSIIARSGFNPKSDHAIRIPLTEPVQYPAREHYIPPYVLGVLLGDGGISQIVNNITSGDPEILQNIENDFPTCQIHKLKCKYGYSLHPSCDINHELHRLNLKGKLSYEKHIPNEYLHDSVSNRIRLLQGLMDTDGSIYGKCQMEYYTSSEKLANDVQYLVQSLGGTAKIKTKKTYYKKAGKKISCRLCYRVKIKLKDINPFRIKRKASKFYPIRYERTRILKSIRLIRKENSRCITIDSPEQTYLTNNFIVTHNSVSLGIRDILLAHLLPGFKEMYICPRLEQLKTYADKLNEIEQSYRFHQRHTNYRDNLYYKEYPNKSMIKLMYCLTNASKIRGNTVDQISFDEYQDFDINLELEVQEIQSASDMPITLYSGTSLTTDTALEAKFSESSRGIWTMKCSGCNHDNQPTIEGNVLDMIQLQGPSCVKCGKLLNVRNGFFKHENEDMLRNGKIGFHIPKIIVPENVEKEHKWLRIYEQSKTKDTRKFYQEVLGIPTAEGEREITRGHLEAICRDMPDTDSLKKKAKDNKYHYIISGCDWGGSDYNPAEKTKESWTVHTMVGINVDYDFEIIHFRKYGGMDYDSVSQDIIHNHKALGGFAIASDFGVGANYNMQIRQHISPEKHFIFQYAGPASPMITEPKNSFLFNRYLINKTETITQLFEAIKSHRIKCYKWDQSAEFLLEFLNLYRTPSETPGGATTFTYRRHGARPDDSLHAVNFAFLLGRILIGEPIFEDISLKRKLEKSLRSKVQFNLPNSGFGGGAFSV